MERIIAYSPEQSELLSNKEPNLHVRLDEPFIPFAADDFAGRSLASPDFYTSRSFTLDGFGVGEVRYNRDTLLGFSPEWAREHAATPLGPANLSFLFRLATEPDAVLVPPLELQVLLHGRRDRYPPDQLLEFPSFGRAVLGRWERRIDDPELHPLPLVIPRQFLLPEWREIRTLYLPEEPRILSDLRVTFLATAPNVTNGNPKAATWEP